MTTVAPKTTKTAPMSRTQDAAHPYALGGLWATGGYATAAFFGVVHFETFNPAETLADEMAHAQHLPQDADAPVATPAPAADVEAARKGASVRSDRRRTRMYDARRAVGL